MPFNVEIVHLSFINIIDILIVAIALLWAVRLIANTRAVPLLKGLGVLVVITGLSGLLGLTLVNWILEKVLTALVVALPVVFYPELRRALEQIGRGKFLRRAFFLDKKQVDSLVVEVVRAVEYLVEQNYGGLIIIERQTGLGEYLDSGIFLDATVSMELLTTIFQPNNLLHDGAVVIREDRIVSAGVVLPLSDNPNISKQLGTRHRAALGISEVSDSIAVVVSEETRIVSVAVSGELIRGFTPETLTQHLQTLLELEEHSFPSFFRPLRSQ